MTYLILIVLGWILNPDFNFHTREVRFEKLPAACLAAYDKTLRNARGDQGTQIAEIDLDGDGQIELVVFNGQSGSGGEGWTLFRKEEAGWRMIGEVFGLLSLVKHQNHTGLLICQPLGWRQASWEYFELINGQLLKRLEITVEYTRPIRQLPQRIKIGICDEK